MFRLDEKLARIRAGAYKRSDFIIADAKDPDMGPGLHAVGPARGRGRGPVSARAPNSSTIQAVVTQDVVDVMLTSVSNLERLVKRDAFNGTGVKPVIRANDTTDIWRHRGAAPSPSLAAVPHRSLQHATALTDLGLYSITFTDDLDADHASLDAFREFRADAEANDFRYFLEVFNPNVALGVAAGTMPAIRQRRDRPLPRRPHRGRAAAFLKIAYNGPKALEELASFDPGLVVGVLGGGAGTTRDCFELIHQAEKHGARVALFGRKINLAESPLDIVRLMRAVADGAIMPLDAVSAYHDALRRQNVKPIARHRRRQRDHRAGPEAGLIDEPTTGRPVRRHLVRRSQQDDPALAGGGHVERSHRDRPPRRRSGSNMAFDLKRLDPALRSRGWASSATTKTGAFSSLNATLMASAARGSGCSPTGRRCASTPSPCETTGRRTHFYFQGVAADMTPEHFDFSARTRASFTSACPERTGDGSALARRRQRLGHDASHGAGGGPATNIELMTTAAERLAELGRPCLPHLDLLIVNDFEIGAIAELETRRADGATDAAAVARAIDELLAFGPMRCVVAHFPEGAVVGGRDGSRFALGSVALPPSAIAGANGAGDAFAAGMLYALHEDWGIENAARLAHACAAASMRALSTTAGVAGRRLSRARRSMGLSAGAR